MSGGTFGKVESDNGETLVIHVGYPKAGSSSLQQNVFTNNTELAYLAGDGNENTRFYKNILHADNEYKVERLRNQWISEINPMLPSYRTKILSLEQLTSNRASAPVLAVPKRLGSVFGDCKVVIIIRSQTELLRSYYDFFPGFGEIRIGGFCRLHVGWKRCSATPSTRSPER